MGRSPSIYIAPTLRDLIVSQGILEKEFAAKAGVDKAYISLLCNGNTVALPTARKIAAALGMEVDAVFVNQAAEMARRNAETFRAIGAVRLAEQEEEYRQEIDKAP